MRLNKLDKIMEEERVQCSVVLSGATIFYLTGYDYITTDIGNAVALVYCDGVPTLIVPVLEKNRAEAKVGDKIEVLSYSYSLIGERVFKGGLIDAIATKINPPKKVGIDMQNSSSSFYLSFKEKVGDYIDISKKLAMERAIKEDEELELIKKAGNITTSAMRIGSEKIQNTGITEREVAGLIDMTMRNEGAEDYAFPSIVAFGENSAFPHHVPSDKTIRENDNAVVDIGARYRNYCFDSTRTFIKGNSEEVKKIYEIVLQAQLEAIDTIREGVKASEVDLAARRVIEKAGFGKYFIHSTGHGVGIEVHEFPAVSPTSNDVLKENMVITVEPGIYLKGKFGVRIEDTVIVTKKKAIVLETVYKYL